jgi:hypothetical protein
MLDPGEKRIDRVASINADLALEPSQMDKADLDRNGLQSERLSSRNPVLSWTEVTKLAVVSNGDPNIGLGEFNYGQPHSRVLEGVAKVLEAGPRQDSLALDRPAEIGDVKKVALDKVRCPQGDKIAPNRPPAGSSPQGIGICPGGPMVQAGLDDFLDIAMGSGGGHRLKHRLPITCPDELVLETHYFRHPSRARFQSPLQLLWINVDD